MLLLLSETSWAEWLHLTVSQHRGSIGSNTSMHIYGIKCSKDTRANGILIRTYYQNKNTRLFSKTLYMCPFSRSLPIVFWSKIPPGLLYCLPWSSHLVWLLQICSPLCGPSSILTFLLKLFNGVPLLLKLSIFLS